MASDDSDTHGKRNESKVPTTERVNPASVGIDVKPIDDVVATIHAEDQRAWSAVGESLGEVADVVEVVAEAMAVGGRLFYVGAGTSGRLGVLDASECPPTFGVPPTLVQGIIAGGDRALRCSVEGAEDRPEDGAAEIIERHVRHRDVVCGIAASGRTPFVWGALEEASKRDATTVLITCNPDWQRRTTCGCVDRAIVLDVGPEVVAGSSRLKAGTATKLVLNTITTGAMIRLGKVYDNLMVDLLPANAKLRERSRRMVCRIAEVDDEQAEASLAQSNGAVKTAVLVCRGLTVEDAERLLAEHGGVLRRALEAL